MVTGLVRAMNVQFTSSAIATVMQTGHAGTALAALSVHNTHHRLPAPIDHEQTMIAATTDTAADLPTGVLGVYVLLRR